MKNIDNNGLELNIHSRLTNYTLYYFYNINNSFKFPKVIDKLLCSRQQSEILLGLNLLLLNEK
jgi:hypothetical protein